MHDREVDTNRVMHEGDTVEDAVEKGLERLGVTRDKVEVEVIEEGSRGVLGFIGAKRAKVLLRRKDDSAGALAKVEELAGNLMRLMDVSSQIGVKYEEDIHKVKIDTVGADGLLIGKKGQNLEALEHLLRRMVGKQLKRSVRMEVDVGGYRERRVSSLRSKAASMASRVKASGKEMQVEPLSAAERRIIHLTLAEDPQVKTYTIGDGDLKNVVIAPQRRGSRSAQPKETPVE